MNDENNKGVSDNVKVSFSRFSAIIFNEPFNINKNLRKYAESISEYLSADYLERLEIKDGEEGSIFEITYPIENGKRLDRSFRYPSYSIPDKGLLLESLRHNGFLARVPLRSFEVKEQVYTDIDNPVEFIRYNPILTFYSAGILALRVDIEIPQNIAVDNADNFGLGKVKYKTIDTVPYNGITATIKGDNIGTMGNVYQTLLFKISNPINDKLKMSGFSDYQLMQLITIFEYPNEDYIKNDAEISAYGFNGKIDLHLGNYYDISDKYRRFLFLNSAAKGTIGGYPFRGYEFIEFYKNVFDLAHASGYAATVLKRKIPVISDSIIKSRKLKAKYLKSTGFSRLERDYIRLRIFVNSVLSTDDYFKELKEVKRVNDKLQEIEKTITNFNSLIQRSIAEKTYKYTKSLNVIMVLLTFAAAVFAFFTVLDYLFK